VPHKFLTQAAPCSVLHTRLSSTLLNHTRDRIGHLF